LVREIWLVRVLSRFGFGVSFSPKLKIWLVRVLGRFGFGVSFSPKLFSALYM